MPTEPVARGPLRHIILAQTGQDIVNCKACHCCCLDEALEVRLDLHPWQVMAAAQKNQNRALTNRTIWLLAAASPQAVRCANGLDVVAIARVLCAEARRRGLAPEDMGINAILGGSR